MAGLPDSTLAPGSPGFNERKVLAPTRRSLVGPSSDLSGLAGEPTRPDLLPTLPIWH